MKRAVWHLHPHVRSGSQLTIGERAADFLKHWFGSWTFLIGLNVLMGTYVVLSLLHVTHFDPYPFILLNLVLSWLAGNQGGALQIASNRGDRVASELAVGNYKNSQEILKINQAQMEILKKLDRIEDSIERGNA